MWNSGKNYPVKELPAPPRTWKSAPCSPMPPPEKKRSSPPRKQDVFHVIHKVPPGDSPYVRAKQVQLIDRDPNRAISLFWYAINAGDRVDSALKDMAIVMKQLNRSDEAIEAIKSFRHLCSERTQESLDNVLNDLYKRCGRFRDQIELLWHKLKLIEDGIAFGGKKTKIARSQGKKFHVTIEQEKSRLLGNLAWAYLQEKDYQTAEELYRRALSIEPDKNKQCNLSICLMHRGEITKAKSLLQAIAPSSADRGLADPYIKSFDRASEILAEIESQPTTDATEQTKEIKESSFTSPINKISSSRASSVNAIQSHGFGFPIPRRLEDSSNKDLVQLEAQKRESVSSGNHKSELYSQNLIDEADPSGFDNGRLNTEMKAEESSCNTKKDCQSSQQPFFANKWRKGAHSEKIYRTSDYFTSQKGISERRRVEGGSATKNTKHNGSIFSSQVSIDENIMHGWTEKISGSHSSSGGVMAPQQLKGGLPVDVCGGHSKITPPKRESEPCSSANGDWRCRSRGNIVKKNQTIDGISWYSNGDSRTRSQEGNEQKKLGVGESTSISSPKILGESPSILVGNSHAMSQEKLNGVTRACINGNWDQRSEITVSDSMRWSDKIENKNVRINIHEADNIPVSVTGNANPTQEYSVFKTGKSWADMVDEEEEEELSAAGTDFLIEKQAYLSGDSSVSFQNPNKWADGWNNDENLNLNITGSTPPLPTATRSQLGFYSQKHPFSQNNTEIFEWKLGMVDLNEEENGRHINSASFGNSKARRCLSFDQQPKLDPVDYYCCSSTPMASKALGTEDYNCSTTGSTCGKNLKPMVRTARRKRLQVFRDITLLPDSPRAYYPT
ncbi:PREDICTED: uncharacterized protein LOC104598291 isoform X2 [Nelumbo nucifera]|uniref:Uncharacterized protein LOC104598291 isoform X2 n=1 Tax=Nelumbo nucifera TaxID=4432 RepID=A0A1U8AAD3_NELNU|nr:PREDICTED: uncharacterized protein LOC104598291 isoform X2 [Nelumbo nucifera]